ncbi:MAG: winged helix-turn-helix transcriptional regulator [Deltaproteobacteria bacterium]|nr:MAG: winged helix-turn-helix transcriptional regulator [Deltaproteobacteria bacterium]
MNRDELRTLRALEAIESGEVKSQRELAKDLNISLGLANAFMKRLARKGYFKISTIPKNRVKYLLTPEGVREKSRLTYEYVRYSIGFYREIKEILLSLFTRLQDEGVQRIALYGSGEVAELAYLFLQNTYIKLAGVFDEQPDGREFFGHKLESYEELANSRCDYVLLTETEDVQRHYDRLVHVGVERDCILHLRDQTTGVSGRRQKEAAVFCSQLLKRSKRRNGQHNHNTGLTNK